MPVHLRDHIREGRHIPGILTLSNNMSIGEVIEELLTVAEAAFDDEFQDRIDYLPITQ